MNTEKKEIHIRLRCTFAHDEQEPLDLWRKVHDLKITSHCQMVTTNESAFSVLEDSLAVISLGKLRGENANSCGLSSYLTKNGRRTRFGADNHVPVVFLVYYCCKSLLKMHPRSTDDASHGVVDSIPPPAIPPPTPPPATPRSNKFSGMHSSVTCFSKFPNCDVCKRTESTGVPCKNHPERQAQRTHKVDKSMISSQPITMSSKSNMNLVFGRNMPLLCKMCDTVHPRSSSQKQTAKETASSLQ